MREKVEREKIEREKVERAWFVRIAFILMVCGISVGAFPIMKSMMFPVERIR